MEELRRMRLFNVELEQNVLENDSVLIARPNDVDGEIIKVPISSVFDKYTKEYDIYIKGAYSKGGHLILELSNDSIIDIGIIDRSIPTYGVCRDVNSHSPTLKRVGDAVDLVANAGVGSEIVRNDFDNIYPWCAIRKCTLADDGTVTSYEGDANYKEDGSIGQVMVEIPKFYLAHYLDESGAKEYWYISKEKINSRYRLPKPFIAKDGTELNAIYIAAYFSSEHSKEKKISDSLGGNVYCCEDALFDTAVQYAASRGTNWHIFDISEMSDVIQPLFIIEFATLDSQSIMYGSPNNMSEDIYLYISEETYLNGDDTPTEQIGNSFCCEGIDKLFVGQEIAIPTSAEYLTSDIDDTEYSYAVRKITAIDEVFDKEFGNLDEAIGIKVTFNGEPIKLTNYTSFAVNKHRNGVTNDIAASSGSVPGILGTCEMKYRGIENLYNYEYTCLAGAFLYSGKYYISENANNYTLSLDDFIESSCAVPDKPGYISKIETDSDISGISLPVQADGSSDIDFCDQFSKIGRNTSTMYPCCINSADSTAGGLFSYSFNHSLTSFVCSRVAYRKYE